MFAIASYVEKRVAKGGKNILDNGLIYSLSLALYATAWTFYGNIGLMTTNSFLFLTVYLGATLSILLWRRIVKIYIRKRNEFGLTSIADFISFRYNKSQPVGVIVTMITLVGIMPYIALQLEAVITSFSILVGQHQVLTSGLKTSFDILILMIMILFSVLFGMRKLDLEERHPSMVMIVAIQSVIKLSIYLLAGIFVAFFMYHGIGDIFAQVAANPQLLLSQKNNIPPFDLWFSYLIISMSAIIFLPRQFHVTVVENVNEKNLKTAIWMLPLYFLAITLFVIPIGLAGLLHGLPAAKADYFMPLLVLGSGQNWLALLVFMGGFAAASSMVMVETLTLTTMATNYLILPVIEKIKTFNFLRRFLLQIRWAVAVFIILASYWIKTQLGSTYLLVKIGTISFAATLQFAPVMLGAIFWKKGNRIGAAWGMLAGFFVWAYTSLLPAFAKSGIVSINILTNGPFGIKFLRPENLFGTQLSALSNTVLFSMLFNVGLYIVGSLLFKQTEEGHRIAESFTGKSGVGSALEAPLRISEEKEYINLNNKKIVILDIFSHYVKSDDAKLILEKSLKKAAIENKKLISIKDLANFYNIIEKALSEYTGASMARDVLKQNKFIENNESNDLSAYYGKLISELKLTPEELAEKLNYSQEKEKILEEQGKELERVVKNRTNELQEKIVELEKFQKLTVDREIRMIELKNKVKELEMKKN